MFHNRTARFFAFSSIIEGTTEKMLQFKMLLKSIFDRNFGFIEQKKCIFEYCREFQASKTLLIDIIFAMKKNSIDLFRAAPYLLILVLHRDVLFSLTIAALFIKVYRQ